MLAQNKIFANEKLMLVHLISFIVITITATIFGTILLTGVLNKDKDDPDDSYNEHQKRILLFEIIVAYIDGTADMGVVVTMMIMFTKHSLTISEDKQK